MLGLGETDDDIRQTLADLRDIDVDVVTFGQYLQPSRRDLLPACLMLLSKEK
jgi:lipoic acid synthetase